MHARRLLILGATGGTGQHILSQALQQGREVTVFVRSPQKLTTVHDHLRIVQGDVTRDPGPLADSVRGQDAVISALGVGNSLKSGGLIAASMKAIVAATEREGVRRLIFMSAYGVGATRIDVPLLPRILMRLLLRDLYADKAAAEEDLRRSSLDWTLVYPATLTNGPATGQWRAGERLALSGFPRVPRADVARFILAQVEDATYLRKGVLISR
ncbi:MAG: nucleoside-diphosphate sugar epimerase [candidate division NC10 bacterium]|nr:nucleoside-diphosphate sugar epimerase [candidate division NC10 bacterium]